VEVERVQFVGLAAAFEDGRDGGEHAEVIVVCEGEFQVADSLEDGQAEEVVEVEECAVDHGVEVFDHEGLGVDDFRGFLFDLLVQQEDGGSGQFLEIRVLVAEMG
jgi:hypothetical protein